MKIDLAEKRGQKPSTGQASDRQEVAFDDSDRSQIVQRLHWQPKERLDYLVDMLAFEERARRARKL